ncbi:MAG: DUF3857 domain-containing protein [Planctomycetota bacterium]
MRLGRSGFLAWALCTVTAVTTPCAAQLWDGAFRAADLDGAVAVHEQRLATDDYQAYPHLPGTPEQRQPTCEELELRALHLRVAAHGDYRRALRIVDRFLESPRTPNVEAFAHYLRALYLWHCGSHAESRATAQQLGVLSAWSLIGPYDNDRGSGFEEPYEPEEDPYDPNERYLGKRDYISWRQWEEVGIAGSLRLDHLLRPNDEALAYLQTHIYAQKERDIVIRTGSSGAVALWWNGQEVLRRDVDRPHAFDQDAVVVHLGAGWNSLLVKSGHTKGTWAVRVRLTDRAGRALLATPVVDTAVPKVPLAQQAVLPSDARANDFVAPVDKSLDLGARTVLAKDATPTTLILSGWLTSQIHAHDRSERPERELYEAALRDDPNNAIGHYLVAKTYRTRITHSAEREENRWRVELERVLELDPTFDRARYELCGYYLQRFGNFVRAKQLLAPALRRVSADGVRPTAAEPAWKLQQRLLRGRYGLAASVKHRTMREQLLQTQPLQGLRVATARRLATEGRTPAAIALLQAGLAFDTTHGQLQRELSRRLLQSGQLDAARESVQQRIAARSSDGASYVALYDLESAAENWQSALTAIDEAIVIAPDDEDYRKRRGDVLRILGQNKGALLEYAKSLELEPNQPRLREYVELATGDSDDLEEQYRIPTSDIVAAALTADDEDVPLRVLLQNTTVRIAQDGTTARYVQYLAKVVNDQGVRTLDYYNIPYAYGEQWVKVLKAQVHHKDGDVEEAQIRNRDPYVREGEYPIWSQAWVDLPPLQPGDVVEIEYRKEDLRQSFFGDYFGDSVHFAGLEPWDHVRYTVICPADKSLHFYPQRMNVSPVEETRNDERISRWEMRNQPRIDPEPGMPPLTDAVPLLEVSSIPDWDAFTDWYYHLIRKQFESSAAIKAKVAELTVDFKTDADKARALYNFVVQEIRYIAWEFGVHGFKPYKASTIFTRRFGDCKDKATLLCTMLAEVDIAAHPVLIKGTRNRPLEDLKLPLVSHFNHCIAYIPSLGKGGHFVDGTAEHHSFEQLPLMDYGARVLVVKESGGDVTTIPWNAPKDFSITERQWIKVDGSGNATIKVELQPRGDFSTSIRSAYEVVGQHKERLEQHYGRRFPGARVTRAEFSDLRNLDEPTAVRFELTVPQFLQSAGESITLPPIIDFFQSTGGLTRFASRPQRQLDLNLSNPRASHLEIEIELPPGHVVDHLPRARTMETPHTKFEFRQRSDGQSLHLERTLEFSAPRLAPADYPAFRQFVNDIEAWRTEQITLRKTEGAQ